MVFLNFYKIVNVRKYDYVADTFGTDVTYTKKSAPHAFQFFEFIKFVRREFCSMKYVAIRTIRG
jgi:hypothetical protein